MSGVLSKPTTDHGTAKRVQFSRFGWNSAALSCRTVTNLPAGQRRIFWANTKPLKSFNIVYSVQRRATGNYEKDYLYCSLNASNPHSQCSPLLSQQPPDLRLDVEMVESGKLPIAVTQVLWQLLDFRGQVRWANDGCGEAPAQTDSPREGAGKRGTLSSSAAAPRIESKGFTSK